MFIRNSSGFFILVSACCLLISCGSLPSPQTPNDSLLVVVISTDEVIRPGMKLSVPGMLEISGPLTASIGVDSGDRAIRTFRCIAGEYTVSFLLENGTKHSESVSVMENTIVCFSLAFGRGADGTMTAYPVGTEEREQAVKMLSDFISYENWIGKDFVGFGPFRPRMFLSGNRYTLDITSTIEGGKVFIDGDEWGKVPVSVELPAGKYLVSVEHEGYTAYRKYLTLDGDTKLEAVLLPNVKQETGAARNTFNLHISPLVNLGKAADAVYGTVFLDSFAVNFRGDSRLAVSRQGAGDGAIGKTMPDFKEANEIGADLLLTGTYSIRENRIFVWAGLYDVKSERIKLAISDTGDAGVKVFETVDRITERFSKAVSETLPAPGEPVIVREKEMTDTRIEYERLLFRKDAIAKLSERKNLAGITAGFFGPQPPFLFMLRYERIVTEEFALCAYAGIGMGNGISIDLFAGPQLVFKTGTMDLCCGLLGCFIDYFGDKETPDMRKYTVGIDLETSLKFYLGSTKSGLSPYVIAGMIIDALNFGFTENWASPSWIPMSGEIFAGWGVGL